jgi:hypothetical protein
VFRTLITLSLIDGLPGVVTGTQIGGGSFLGFTKKFFVGNFN